jgi:hypothetical protein
VKSQAVGSNHSIQMLSKLTLLCICLASLSVARAQNVLVNGNFDEPPPNMDGTVTGWDVTGHVAAVTGQGFTTADQAAALSVSGSFEGDMLAQTFTTTIGQAYALDFDAGVYGKPTAGPLSLQIQVMGTSTLLDQTVQPPNNNDFNPAPFNHYSYMFTADSTSTTLKFTDSGGGNQNADVMVDTVSVSAVPEPASSALVIMGAASLGLVLSRKGVQARIDQKSDVQPLS